MNFGRYIFSEPYLGWLVSGVGMTLVITALSGTMAMVLALAVTTARISDRPSRRWMARIYICVFRNLPPVPLLLFLVFALPGLYRGLVGAAFPRGMEFGLLIAGLALNTSAYLAEILRAGIRGVPLQHWDAARVCGLGRGKTLLLAIYPQALRITLPALGTRLIHNMKNSSIALVLPLSPIYMDVTSQAGRIAGQTFAWAEPLVFTAGVYMTLTLVLSSLVSRMASRSQLKVEPSR
ncbi:MAG: ABC transporter permease subunit [bacterium]|nr:ABC transporter permease subunit [bacterium]